MSNFDDERGRVHPLAAARRIAERITARMPTPPEGCIALVHAGGAYGYFVVASLNDLDFEAGALAVVGGADGEPSGVLNRPGERRIDDPDGKKALMLGTNMRAMMSRHGDEVRQTCNAGLVPIVVALEADDEPGRHRSFVLTNEPGGLGPEGEAKAQALARLRATLH